MNPRWIKALARGFPEAILGIRRLRLKYCGHPDWRPLLRRSRGRWDEALRRARDGPRVLVATSLGSHVSATRLESLLAAALTLRGARVTVLLCDEALPACQESLVSWFRDPGDLARGGQAGLCRGCFEPACRMFRSLGIEVLPYGRFLPGPFRESVRQEVSGIPASALRAYRWQGLAVGEQAWAGTLRYFSRGTLDGEPDAELVLRKYLEAALRTGKVMEGLLREGDFSCAVLHHGLYVPQGVIGEACRSRGVRVVTWNPAYRKQCFIFSHGDTYHRTLLQEPVSEWETFPWSDRLDRRIGAYLKSRWSGKEDWIRFHEHPEADPGVLREALGLDDRPVVGLLTNVMWDAQLHYPANAFLDQREWTRATIGYFSGRPDLQLLIRIHPAEVNGLIPSRQPLAEEIRKDFPVLPDQVKLVPPDSPLGTYALMELCNAVLLYGTKTGVELAAGGIPVIVAGEAWIRNKGLTRDAHSREEYFRLLGALPFPGRMSSEEVRRARRYAFHFFFRRMIPVGMCHPSCWRFLVTSSFVVKVRDLAGLEPGKDPGLDVICRGILEGSPFIFPAEERG